MQRFESWSYVRKMKICNDASYCILYFLQAINKIYRKAIKEAITESRMERTKALASVIAAVLEIKGRM